MFSEAAVNLYSFTCTYGYPKSICVDFCTAPKNSNPCALLTTCSVFLQFYLKICDHVNGNVTVLWHK